MKQSNLDSPDPELAAWVDAALKGLPCTPAPPAFARRVLDTLRARADRPWWLKAWWEWPRHAQAATFLGALVLVAALARGSILVDEGLANYAEQLGQSPSIQSLTESARTFSDAVDLVIAAGQPWLLHGLVLLAGLYALCAGLGTVLFRFALRRA